MPIVQINMVEGRPPEKVEAMITAVSEAIATSIGAPIDNVRVMVNEMQEHQYGVGGKPIAQVRAERRATQTTEEESA